MRREPLRAVTFDFGQTLCSLDTDMLARRLLEREVTLTPESLDGALGKAWWAYSAAIRAGAGGHPWSVLMDSLLHGAGLSDARARKHSVDWLWSEQPKQNLWRKPVEGMIELARELKAQGVPIAVLSNSEGKLAELIAELGWTSDFHAVADSGCLGFEKPDRAIFAWTADQLGVPLERIAHIGDAWAADFEGALAAGMHAVLFKGRSSMPDHATIPSGARADVCDTAPELRVVLQRWGLPLK